MGNRAAAEQPVHTPEAVFYPDSSPRKTAFSLRGSEIAFSSLPRKGKDNKPLEAINSLISKPRRSIWAASCMLNRSYMQKTCAQHFGMRPKIIKMAENDEI